MFKLVRITILLLVLASVASTFWLHRNVSRDWSGTLDIEIIPVIADSHSVTVDYVKKLKPENFSNIEKYLVSQASDYGTDISHGFDISLGQAIFKIPPVTPSTDSGTLEILVWSLALRWWAWRNQPDDYHSSQIRLYVLYQNPEPGVALPHSTGLRNGLIGLIHARVNGSQSEFHNLVITHELLHIFGAKDKYDLSTGQPIYPEGYAEPKRLPLHPQKVAEIMGRSIPIAKTKHRTALQLRNTVIGITTAQELGWVN